MNDEYTKKGRQQGIEVSNLWGPSCLNVLVVQAKAYLFSLQNSLLTYYMSLNLEPLDFCVLIPCFNNFKGLIQSLNSIEYERGKFKVVIVDDGSNLPLNLNAIRSSLHKQLPLHLISYQPNKGITDALNTGLDWILQHTDSKYIARLDCSDTCHPQRFYLQVQYLDNHPQVGLIGSWCYFQSEDATIRYRYITPTNHKEIKKVMHLRNVFIHPTVMFRTDLVKRIGNYPYNYPHAEDYAFFWSMLNSSEGVILNQYLVTCAINTKGISFSNRKEQLHSRQEVVMKFGSYPVLKLLGILKLQFMVLIPQSFILKLKRID